MKCFRPTKTCYCKYIRPFDTRTRFLLLMHEKEFKKERLGTGRLTHLCLKNSEIIMGVDYTDNKRLNDYLSDERYAPYLLYPGEEALDVSGNRKFTVLQGKIPLILIIDSTWAWSRKIMRLSKNLHDLPRICFWNESPSKFDIKKQPKEFCLSTIESVYRLLEALERSKMEDLKGKHNVLPDVLSRLVLFQKKCISDPEMTYYRSRKNLKKKSAAPE